MNEEKRQGWSSSYIQNLYAVLIVLTVTGEFINQCTSGSDVSKGLFLFIYSFHMPLLMFINGAVCRDKKPDARQTLHGVVFFLCLYVFQKLMISIVRMPFKGGFRFALLSEGGIPWLFFVMAVYLLAAYVLNSRNISEKWIKVIAIGSVLAALVCGYATWIGDFLMLSRIIVFLPCFLAGYMVGSEKLVKWSRRTDRVWVKVLAGYILLMALLFMVQYLDSCYFLRPLFTGRNPYAELGARAGKGWMYRLAAYAVSFVMSASVLAIMPRESVKGVTDRFGGRFLQIYFWFQPVLYILTGAGIFSLLEERIGHRGGRIIWLMFGLLCVYILSSEWLGKILFWGIRPVERVWDEIRNFYDNLSQKKKSLLEYAVLYTFCFLIAFLIAYSPFLLGGKTFVWQFDGRRQHYPFMLYIGKAIREIISNAVNGNFGVPLFDLSMGLGDDIIGCLTSIGGTDPLLLLSAFVPMDYGEYLYAFLTIFRLYLAGFSFSYLCFYFQKQKYQTLIGSMVYCFCGYAIFCTMRHPCFVNPMVILPLLIVGLDKILRGGRPHLFIIAAFYAALCGFYHVYMMSIFLGIYGLVRFFDPDIRGNFVVFFHVVMKAVCSYCLGIGLAAIVFLPGIMEFLGAGRNGFSNYNGNYGWSYYLTRMMRFIAPPGDWNDMSFAAIALLALVLLLCSKGKRTLKILSIVAMTIWLTSVGGLVMNGFQYSSNRWTFGLSLLMAYVVVEMLPELIDMTDRQRLLSVITICIYTFIAFFISRVRRLNYVYVGAVFLALTMLVLIGTYKKNIPDKEDCSSANDRKGYAKGYRIRICLFLVIVNVGINGLYKYAPDQGNYAAQFQKMGYEAERIAESGEQDIKMYLGKEIDGRADSSSFTRNTAVSVGIPAMLIYSATAQENVLQYWNEIENSGNELSFSIYSVDQRAIATTLLSQKYHIEAEKRSGYVPYGYSLLGATDMGNQVYQNDYALPWGYTYDAAISYQELEGLDGVRKQETMLQAIALDEQIPNMEYRPISYDSYALPYEISYKDCKWDDGKLVVSKANAEMDLTFSMPAGVEGYVRLDGFDINDSGLTSFTLKVNCGEITKTSLAASHLYSWYYGRENYLFNLGYSDENRKSCKIIFPSKGTFKLDDIELYVLPMSNYPVRVEALRDEPLQDIEWGVNRLTGTVDLSKDKILCMSIPYSKGWTATVDGEKKEILRGNYMFMCIPLTAGHHDIEFSYCSPGLKLGILVSVVSLCIVIGLLVTDRRKSRKR